MPFFRDTVLGLSMTLTRLSGTKSLRDPLVSQLLAESVASSPLAKARWYEATEVAQLPLIRNKQIEAVKQSTGVDRATYGLECPQVRLPAYVRVHDPPGGRLHHRDGPPISPTHPFTRPLHGHMEGVGEAPCARSTGVRAGAPYKRPLLVSTILARYIQSRPPLVETINWKRLLTFLLRGDSYPCAGGSWTQLSIALLNHGARARTPAYLWVIGMAVCGDKDMAALATIWSKNLQVYGRFFSVSFWCEFLEVNT